jgi:alkylhydroperoxidase family enzyme
VNRIIPVDRETNNDRLRKTFDAIQKQLGVVPNMMRTMAHSPAVLDAYLAFGAALHRGLLAASLQEQIALAVAEVNACDYCASDSKAAAALQFASALIDRRGEVTEQDVARVRAAGFGDGEIAEIIAHVGLNVFTNYFNRAVRTEIDFPLVTAGQLA